MPFQLRICKKKKQKFGDDKLLTVFRWARHVGKEKKKIGTSLTLKEEVTCLSLAGAAGDDPSGAASRTSMIP